MLSPAVFAGLYKQAEISSSGGGRDIQDFTPKPKRVPSPCSWERREY